MTWKLFFELFSVVFLTLSIGNLRCVVKSRSFCITFILSCYVVFHVVEVEISSLQFQTALVALIAFFMPTSPSGALGSDDYPKEEWRTLAIKSRDACTTQVWLSWTSKNYWSRGILSSRHPSNCLPLCSIMFWLLYLNLTRFLCWFDVASCLYKR